jgi:hypothetical protein
MGDDDAPDDAPDDAEPTESADAPLEDLAREVRARREGRSGRPDGDGDGVDPDPAAGGRGEGDLFESVEVDEVDDEAVWESFAEDGADPVERVGVGAEVGEATAPDEHVIPKSAFCQRCPHFADPPETACTHDGTAILEVVEGDRFRVRNCPVAAERDAPTDDGFAE